MKHPTKELFLAFTVFSKEPFGILVGTPHVDAYQLLIATIGFVLYVNPTRLFSLVAALAGLIATSLGLFFLNGYPVTDIFLRQVLAVSFVYLGLAAYIVTCSPAKLAAAYVKVCYLAAVFGIVQFCLSAAGVHILIRLPLRLDSFAAEPSHYAVAVAPCVYYCFRYSRSVRAKRRAIIILTSVILTISTTAVVVLAVAFALAFYNCRGIIVALLLAAASPLLVMIPADVFPEVIASRLTDMDTLIESGNESWETNNLTVLSFTTNFEVMYTTIMEGRILGNGFCGHAVAYDRLFGGTEFVNHQRYGINAPAAHCLLIRIVSEFGLPGALLLGIMIWHFVSSRHPDLWGMFFIMAIVGRSLKLGSWVDYGLPLFVLGTVYMQGRTERTAKPQHQLKPHFRHRSRRETRGIHRQLSTR